MSETADVLVIGGGISGFSIAGRLAPHMRVIVAEQEEHPGMHASGRSAALLGEAHGPMEVRQLCGMSRAFFEAPPDGFTEAPLSGPRRLVVYAEEEHLSTLQTEFEVAGETASVEWLTDKEVVEHCPLLKPGVAAAGFTEPHGLALDPHGLLQAFVRVVRRSGGTVLTSAPVERLERRGGAWHVEAGGNEITCGVVVDAAGPWADRVAALAGAVPIGVTPLRRTAATIGVPDDLAAQAAEHPATIPIDESFYFKPEAGALMVSLSEETPSEPCDAFADDLDVALALERFHTATIVPRARPTATWAGLRTFAPDRLPVVGFDSDIDGFFWYAGQGGSGIETSPALSNLAAKLIRGVALETTEAELAKKFSAERFATGNRQ